MIMKKLILLGFFLSLFTPPVTRAADVEGRAGKAGAPAPELKSHEEYDAEAKLRINTFTLPDDVSATLFADPAQTQNPSAICFDSKGRMYIAEIHRWRAGVQDIRNEQRLLLDDISTVTSEDRLAMYEKDALSRPLSFYSEYSDQIVRVEDTNGDGRADKSALWAGGFNDPLDGPGIGLMADGSDTIFYTNIPHLWKLEDADGDGTAEKRESIQDGFGVRMSLSGHDMHGLARGPDGKIYWSIGDRGYHFTTKEGRHYSRPYEGAVFRCDPDGSNVEEFYRGLRNPQELAFDKYGNLFTCDNDADAWDKGRLVYLLEGGESGWHHGHQVLLNFRDQLNLRTPDYQHPDHKEIPMNAWMTEALWENLHDERVAYALPPVDAVSWGPSGLVYNYGVTTMPERYADHFWICNFGGAKGDLEAFSVKEKGAGFALDHHEIFMVGLGNTDVEFGPDGKMYLSCFNNNGWYKQDIGNVYALSQKEGAQSDLLKSTEALLLSDFSKMNPGELSEHLSHADLRVRQRAQFALVDKDESEALLKATQQTDHQLKRLHGVWGLGQLARKDETLLDSHISLLSDSDAEVRAQAAKILSDSRTEKAGDALVAALDDESSRVKGFAAIGVGKCNIVTALPKLIEMLAANNNADVYLRHACIQGLWYLNQREKILKQTKNPSAAVRLGVLLTLRKLEDPRVKYFLKDDDKFIRYEAIRAINDLNLITALPDLAAEIDAFAAASSEVEMPADHRDGIIQTRLINANFRVGRPENAERLLAYAAQEKLPELLREQALLAIEEWPNPTPVDPTTGFYRPIDHESRVDIAEAVKKGIGPVFDSASGKLLGVTTRVALKYGAKAPVDLLTQQIADESADTESRIGSLAGLARQQPEALDPLWAGLIGSKDSKIRSAAVGAMMSVDKDRGIGEALKLAGSKVVKDKQSAYTLLATSDDPRAAELFLSGLKQLDQVKPGAKLDLLEGAALRKEEAVVSALAAYNASLDPANLMAPFLPTLQGGDAKRGKTIFMTHAAGQCAKCHKLGGDGGEAGPDLSDLGARHDRQYILESLVNPSAVVVPGYGLTLVSLKNGDNVGGALLKEDEKSITVRVPDEKDSSKQIERVISLEEIASRQPPVSAMPPMAFILTKKETRDLVAFLASQKKKK